MAGQIINHWEKFFVNMLRQRQPNLIETTYLSIQKSFLVNKQIKFEVAVVKSTWSYLWMGSMLFFLKSIKLISLCTLSNQTMNKGYICASFWHTYKTEPFIVSCLWYF